MGSKLPDIKKVIVMTIFALTLFYVMANQLPIYYLFGAYFVYAVILSIVFYPSLLSLMGNYSFAKGNHETARRMYDKAASKKSKSPTIYLNYGILLVREGKAAEALVQLEKAEAYNKNILTAKNIKLTKGSCYWILGEIDKAIETLEAMRKEYDYVNVHVFTTLGYMYLIKGDLAKAKEITEKAIEDNSNSGAAWDNLGQIYFKQDELTEAKKAFLRAVECNKDLVDSYYYLGMIAELENDLETAKAHYKNASKCQISALNTVTREQVESKLKEIGV